MPRINNKCTCAWVTVKSGGRVNIPLELRKMLDIKSGNRFLVLAGAGKKFISLISFKDKNIRTFLLGISLFACFLLGGCRETELASYCRDRSITIDGKYGDWLNAESYYYEKEKLVINLLNDSDYLYICLITRNRSLETKIMESGLVVWFDPSGKKGNTFGIRYPASLRSLGVSPVENDIDPDRDWHDQEDKGGVIDRSKERLKDKGFNDRLETLEKLADRIEILDKPLSDSPQDRPKEKKGPDGPGKGHSGPGGDGLRPDKPEKEIMLEEAAKMGIEAKVGRDNDYFVYELKIPLKKSTTRPYAIGIMTGKPIGLGFELTSSRRPGNMREDRQMPPAELSSGINPEDTFHFWAVLSLCQPNQ